MPPQGMRRLVGIGAALQGVALAAVSLEIVPAALRVAEILYGEDFDRAGIVPSWFQPWRFAMWHPGATAAVFIVAGAALGVAGTGFAGQRLAARSLEVVLLTVTFLCAGLALALSPLSAMGADWARGTPAHGLRVRVVAGTVVLWVQATALLVTLVLVKCGRHQHDDEPRLDSPIAR